MTATTRGTSNGSARGSSYARRARRAWLLEHYTSDIPGLCRCYRCGWLLYNPDATPPYLAMDPEGVITMRGPDGVMQLARSLTIDRIIPGCQGGTYRRNNIRPACGPCNSETGGATRATRRNK